jgi:glycine dehydrogenase subunit 1
MIVPYIPTTDSQKAEMLAAMGIDSIEKLFDDIPKDFRFPAINIDAELSEIEVLRDMQKLADKNVHANQCKWFLGAGAYDHFVPSAVGALCSRGEFLTSYTPYQPEVSQGTLQAIFEYQSMICNLTGMDVVNASHYDGATALAEAVLMAVRIDDARNLVLIPEALHPEYKEVIKTYLAAFNVIFEEYKSSPKEAAESVGNNLAAVIASYPDFYGIVPEMDGAAEAVHEKGGLFIVHADPIMLGLLKSPGEFGADIVTAEGQSLGNELSYGGPYLGIMAVTEKLMRKIPGRIVGVANDTEGRRGFVLTLAAREQHIRREKAVSNICSNQGLAALRACIYLCLMGKTGLKQVAELCWHRSHYAAKEIASIPGCKVSGGIFFKEFVVTLPCDAETLAEKLFAKNIIAGFPLSRYFPDKANELLVCVTEKNSKSDIDDLVSAIREAVK